MESLESPLNLAHIESRKADKFQKAEKWDDAIESHSRAKELLTQAENLTEDKNVLESLWLQKESHTRQVALLEHRKELSKFINKYRANRVPRGPTMQYVIDEVDIGELRLHDIPSAQDIGSSSGSDDDDIMKTIVKCDSLLYILNKRGRSSGNSTATDLQKNPSGTKIPKDERQIMEELKTQNDELRYHILNLLQEADNQQSEILTLQNRNAELQGKVYMLEHQQNNIEFKSESETDLKNKTESGTGLNVCDNDGEEEEEADYFLTGDNMDLESMDLPPLEIPQFEYSNEADI